MQVISMSQNKYKQLTKMNVLKEVFNTEAIIYNFRYKGQDKVFKKLLNNTGVNLANKLYTLGNARCKQNIYRKTYVYLIILQFCRWSS